MPICTGPHRSGWLLSFAYLSQKSHCYMPHNKHNAQLKGQNNMERIILVGFLECNNGRNCELHQFGCGNSLVLNREGCCVGLWLGLCMMVQKSLLVTPSTSMVPIVAVFISQLGSMQQERMVICWMVPWWRSPRCSHLTWELHDAMPLPLQSWLRIRRCCPF